MQAKSASDISLYWSKDKTLFNVAGIAITIESNMFVPVLGCKTHLLTHGWVSFGFTVLCCDYLILVCFDRGNLFRSISIYRFLFLFFFWGQYDYFLLSNKVYEANDIFLVHCSIDDWAVKIVGSSVLGLKPLCFHITQSPRYSTF